MEVKRRRPRERALDWKANPGRRELWVAASGTGPAARATKSGKDSSTRQADRPFLQTVSADRLLASLRGRREGCRMMESEEQNVSICFTTLPAYARRLRTLNEIALPIAPTGTTPSARADSNSSWFTLPFIRLRRASLRRRQRPFHSRTGTRRGRSTSDAGWSQARGPRVRINVFILKGTTGSSHIQKTR